MESLNLEHAESGYCVACGSACKWTDRRRRRKRKPPRRKSAPTIRVSKPPKNSEFTKDDMEHTRALFEAWKKENGVERGGLLSHPTFRIALARLTNLHGYSLTDVGIFLGVSPARVGQWVNKAEIPAARGASMRIWDDGEMRFVNVSSKEYHRIVRERSCVLMPNQIVPRRRRIARWLLIELRDDLGRDPGHVDLADAFQMTGGVLNGFLGVSSNKGSMTVQLDALWRRAGIAERPNMARGGRGRPELEHRPIPGRAIDANIYESRYAVAVVFLKELAAESDTIPTATELAKALGYRVGSNIALRLGMPKGESSATFLDRLWVEAGLGFRPKGRRKP